MTEIPFAISRSRITTEVNKTGSWRFVRPIFQEKTAPCSQACPAGEDIPKIELHLVRGDVRTAWQTIMAENPFPSVCGRVCFHPCEGQCNRREFDEAVSIHRMERFIGDTALVDNYPAPEKAPKTGKRIAIVGGGPAGLSAAYFLARLGHDCEIFESQKEPGGLLRWGIPRYRLPDSLLRQEIGRIRSLGVLIHCNTSISQDFLQTAGDRYQAVFLGCGYGRSMNLRIPGDELAWDGLAFLRGMKNYKQPPLPETAAVIGGGNTAVDLARSLIRKGVRPTILYRRRRSDMPAFSHELEMALKEGVELKELLAPISMEEKGNGILLALQRMRPDFDKTVDGRARVVPDGDRRQNEWFGQVFSAIGAQPAEGWYMPDPASGPTEMSHGILWAHQGLPVFTGGDLGTPIKSVTDAIASGKQAAMALDTWFASGKAAIAERLRACQVGNGPSLSFAVYQNGPRSQRDPHVVRFSEIIPEYFRPAAQVPPPDVPFVQIVDNFEERENTLHRRDAKTEAGRCFHCGVCNDCDTCRLFCPELSVIAEPPRRINADYCKGCGICVTECPRNAMAFEKED